MLTRVCTCVNDFHATYAAEANRPEPMTRNEVRCVATHSITMNRAKNSSEEPRSFWYTMITMVMAQATSTGPRYFGSGRRNGPTFHTLVAMSSR